MTVACAIGMEECEIDALISKLDDTFKSFKKKFN